MLGASFVVALSMAAPLYASANASVEEFVRDGGPLACMYGSPRCGDCRSDGACPDVAESLCAGFGSSVNAEHIMLESAAACLAYAFGDQGDSISNQDLQDANLGLPAAMNGLMRAVFDDDSPLRSANATNNLNSSLPCYVPGPGSMCVKESVKTGMKGSTALDCINDAAFTCGESALEDAACAYISEGAADSICKSKYYGWAKSFVNSVVNKHIEEPIVHAATSVEEACISAAKSVGHWFASFF